MDRNALLSQISSIGLNTTNAVRMPITLPGTDEPLTDMNGKEAYLMLLSEDSKPGRAFDKKVSDYLISKVRRGGIKKAQEEDDPRAFQVEKVVTLCTGWHLVDGNKQPIDLPFTPENATWFLSLDQPPLDDEPGFSMAWLVKQGILFVQNGGNFIKASSKT